jgi:hypothetical protein
MEEVSGLKLLVMVGFLIGFFLSGNQLVSAEENHSNEDSHHEVENHEGNHDESHVENHDEANPHEGHSTSEHSKIVEAEVDHSQMTEEEHQESIKHVDHGNMGHEQDTNKSEEGDVHQEVEEGGHGHGGADLVEKPANMKVLGTFGVINLSFILIGIRNKWFKRKEEE